MKNNSCFTFTIYFILLTSIGLHTGCGGPKGQDIRDMTVAEADSLYKANLDNSGFIILDVRTADEYNAVHIPEAINLDQNGNKFEDELEKLDRNNLYLVYCGDEQRSIEALHSMERKGFISAYRITGGILAWIMAGGTYERIKKE